MATGGNLEKMQMRQQYRNLWHVDLMEAPAEDFAFFCVSCMCGPCVSYLLRKRALYDDMSKYVCCGGYMPCSGRCGESNCPELCLLTEVCCCFNNSVASTRFMLQDEFNIQTSQCDNCIIGFMVCLQQCACICSILSLVTGVSEISDASDMISCVSNMVTCVVCPCMQTQHKVEMDKRDGKYGAQAAAAMTAPPVQQMCRLDKPVSPQAGGYPPPAAYGQPVGHPPPQAYPPAAYPPPGSSPTAYPPPNSASTAYPPPGSAPTSYPPPGTDSYPPPGTGAYPPPGTNNYPPPGTGYPHQGYYH